eukprot:ctg_595.g323
MPGNTLCSALSPRLTERGGRKTHPCSVCSSRPSVALATPPCRKRCGRRCSGTVHRSSWPDPSAWYVLVTFVPENSPLDAAAGSNCPDGVRFPGRGTGGTAGGAHRAPGMGGVESHRCAGLAGDGIDQLRVIVDELQPLVPSARRAQRQWSDRAPPTDEEDRRGAGARRRLRRVGAPADNDGDAALWCLPPELLSPRMRDVWRRRLDDAIGRMQALVRTTAGVTRAGADGARSGATPHKRPRTSLGPLLSAAVSTESKPVPTRDEDTDAARDEPEEHHDEDEVRRPARPRRVKTEESDDENAVTSSAETSASELEFEKVDDDEEYDDSLASDAEHEPVY